MLRRILIALPILLLFIVTGSVFLAARAPQTWAPHWTDPRTVLSAGVSGEYGAVVRGAGRWDLLWVDDRQNRLIYTHRGPTGAATNTTVDSGDISQPSLLRVGPTEFGVWIQNFNGYTELRSARFSHSAEPRSATLLRTARPIEHPYLFAGPHGSIGLVFSWQHTGNFDVYLTSLRPGVPRLGRLHHLTTARYYSFYPRAVTDSAGTIVLLHLESCCNQSGWNVEYARYRPDGRPASPTINLYSIRFPGAAPDASQWSMDLVRDHAGDIYGAFGLDEGAALFKARPDGTIIGAPVLADTDGQWPPSLSLAAQSTGGELFWEQPYSLGYFLESRPFSSSLSLGKTERLEYLAGTQSNPHAAVVDGTPQVIWERTQQGSAGFQGALYHPRGVPNLAARLGLGLGNPWEEAAIVVVGAVSLATIASTVNILIIFGLTLLGWSLIYLLRKLPGRWVVYACFLTLGLYLTLVVPGGPTLFLTPIPTLGLAAMPFGLIAASGSLFFMTWSAYTALRRLDDMYRAAIMAFLGLYFFAFLEASVFIEQHLGFT
jgi:hypothetical protein